MFAFSGVKVKGALRNGCTVLGANGNLAVRAIRCLFQKPGISVRGYARDTLKIPEGIRNHASFQALQGGVRFNITTLMSRRS